MKEKDKTKLQELVAKIGEQSDTTKDTIYGYINSNLVDLANTVAQRIQFSESIQKDTIVTLSNTLQLLQQKVQEIDLQLTSDITKNPNVLKELIFTAIPGLEKSLTILTAIDSLLDIQDTSFSTNRILETNFSQFKAQIKLDVAQIEQLLINKTAALNDFVVNKFSEQTQKINLLEQSNQQLIESIRYSEKRINELEAYINQIADDLTLTSVKIAKLSN